MKIGESSYCQCMYFTTGVLARKMTRLAEQSWEASGLSPSLAYLLLLVLEKPGIQPGKLSGHLQLAPSTVTRLIEKLEEKKLVKREADGKQTLVYPLAKAQKLEPTLQSCRSRFYETFAAILGVEESRTFLANMQRVAEQIDDYTTS